ncbi:hypothetical protein MGYG_04285 [Nannizzia gypsea CBS 118893]|uniref:Uncharacterized protein n=1 Tax=Arthroderma gypseum (strain ATCC MYA-4604 / CBS 118893) TaxID=535722 RepID=E4US76_ARTGP|nr:hypothetical protein MGYG_04285 [Nannizzia gypsea CBS 118893]EFR01280.1 hypothetical protein MGYG_04285 [Nannizzia gypsea CBS 118893]
MLSQKIKHYRLASGPEASQPPDIRSESLEPAKIHTQAGANEISSSTSLLAEGNTSPVDGAKRLWVPFSLRRTTLLSFTALFVVLLSALATIWRIAENNHGLSTVNPSNYYLWTYGPTFVFTIVSALWGQVQYRTLQLFPWRQMSRGSVSAADSVLLDYLSPWNVSALFKSLKRGHFMVSVPIAVSLVIKLMTVLSTGLFVVNDVQLELTKEFQVLKEFNGNNFDLFALDTRTYFKTWGAAQYNFSNPLGVADGHVFESFFSNTSPTETPIYLQNTTYQATVNVFTPSLECWETSVKTFGNKSYGVGLRIDGYAMVINGDRDFSKFPPLGMVLGDSDGNTPSFPAYYNFDPVNITSTDWRLWMYVATSIHENPNGHPVPYPLYPNGTAYADIIGLMCKLSYSTNRGTVTLTAVEHPVKIPGLVNVSASTILYGSYLSVALSTDHMETEEIADGLLNIDEAGPQNISDIRILTDRVTKSIQALAVQLTSEYLMVPSTSTVTGTMGSKETRLTLRNEAFYAIISILGLLALVSLLFCIFFFPSAVCSRDPGSINGIGTILANSPEFMDSLSGMGHAPKEELRKALASQTYITIAKGDTFLIKQNGPEVRKSALTIQLSWWRPFGAAPLARALVFFIPICLLVILEILYWKSRSSDGFANINTRSGYLSYTWIYIPPLVMLGVRSLYECVYFSTRVFQPYHELKRGHASPERSIMDNQHRKLAIVGVWDTLTKRQWSVMAAGIAILIGPSLPIVVSGLYNVSNVASASNITLTQMNRVTIGDERYFYGSASTSNDAKLGDMTIQYNLSYPQWTYQDLSLPKLKINEASLPDKMANALNVSGYFVKAEVPGLRLNMGCEELPPDAYVTGPDPDNDDITSIVVNIPRLVNDCEFESNSIKTGRAILHENSYFSGFAATLSLNTSGLPSSCPTIAVMYGKLGGPTPDTVEAITVITCTPKVEQVDVSIRLSLPSYTFDLSSPPSVVPGSATTLIGEYIDKQELAGPEGERISDAVLDIYPGDNSTNGLRPLFKSIIYGKAAISASALLDVNTLKQELQNVWGIITAQMINSQGREDYDDPLAFSGIKYRPVYSASLINPFSTRISQNMISTRILQAILATMMLCGAISIFLINTREVLPKNPLSIAAAASLLADSRILGSSTTSNHERSKGMIPPGSEWCNDEQLKERGVFHEQTFTLKWWDVKESNDNTNNISDSESQRDSAVLNNDVDGLSGSTTSIQSNAAKTRKRFGIDADDIDDFNSPV